MFPGTTQVLMTKAGAESGEVGIRGLEQLVGSHSALEDTDARTEYPTERVLTVIYCYHCCCYLELVQIFKKL